MNKKAFITGATSGIGAGFTRKLAENGYDLIITGRNMEKMGIVADEVKKRYKTHVEIISADLSEDFDIGKIEESIKDFKPDILVNNAGFGHGSVFMETAKKKVIDMLKVHVQAPTIFTHAALQYMKKNGNGKIINVSSLASFLRARGTTEYVATKSYLVEFSITLDKYLKKNYPGIHVQVLCPGFTHTDFHSTPDLSDFDKKRFPKFMWMDSGQVVKCSLDNLNNRRNPVIPGKFNKFAYFLLNCPLIGKIAKSI